MRALVCPAILTVFALAGCGDDGSSTAAGASAPDTGGTQVPSTSSAGQEAGPEVAFSATFGPPTYAEPVCDGGGRCVFGLSRSDTEVTGALRGTTVSVGAGTPDDTGGYAGVGVHVFTGTVGECGDGVVVWVEQLTSDGEAVTGSWTLLPGAGPDGLAVSGSGTFEGTVGTDGTGAAEASGTIDC